MKKMSSFFWHYLRSYTGWAFLAAAGILVYAAATAGTAALIKPIFGEVLLAGDSVPGPLGAITSAPAAASGSKRREGGALGDLKKHLNLARQIDSSYESLKRRLGVTPGNVVYFVPILFVLVFLLRSLADFISGYAFQHIGLGVTTDVRNDLYRRILQQSSRFHADHPSVTGSADDLANLVSVTLAPISIEGFNATTTRSVRVANLPANVTTAVAAISVTVTIAQNPVVQPSPSPRPSATP